MIEKCLECNKVLPKTFTETIASYLRFFCGDCMHQTVHDWGSKSVHDTLPEGGQNV